MKRILVTGCNGQLGRSLQQVLSGCADVDSLFTDLSVKAAPGFLPLDITDEKQVKAVCSDFRPDYIVNCAAYTAVDRAESEPQLCELLNAAAPAILARCAAIVGARLIHISTDYVFDGTATAPLKETAKTNPQSVYGRTKLQGEQAVERILPGEAVILRTAWLYSPYGTNFPKTMIRLAEERDSLGVVADQCGSPTYAPVLAEAILTVIYSEWHPGIYHLTSECRISWHDLATEVLKLAGKSHIPARPLTTAEYPSAAHRPAYSVLDNSKFISTYHFAIPDWRDSLKEFFKALSDGHH